MFTFTPAAPDEWAAAIALAIAPTPDAERVAHCVNLIENGVLDRRGIFVARENDALVGAQVCVPLAGSACLFWLPVTTGPIAEALVQAGLDWCRSWGCKIAQAQANDSEMSRAAPLIQQGFRPLARLCHMERHLNDLPSGDADLHYTTYLPSNADLFAATLERTYEGTLDCPELNGRRSIDDILAGHRGQGRFDPRFWWLAFADDKPAGVLMLAEMPDGVTWELAYIGIAPEFRRHGIGRALTVHALHALRNCPATRMTLIVDDRNLPARRLYEALGFVSIDTSIALLHFFD